MTFVKGFGNSFLNAVRSAAFLSFPVARPIGFKVGANSNVLNISDNVVEDMTTFIANVSNHVFSYGGNSSVILAEAECEGELRLSQLLEGTGISCADDTVVLHSMIPTKVQVIFGFREGNHLMNDNAKVMANAGYEGFTPVNSRGCILNNFNVHLIEKSDTTETFEVTLSTIDGTSETAVLEHAFGMVKDNVSKALSMLK